MMSEDKIDTAAEDLRTETAGEAPDVAAHDRIATLEAELAEARSAVMYAHAEAQNVRRRAEKEAADARAYAVTGFAREVLSVADNLERGLAAIPEELRGDERMKGLIVGLEATKRELDAVFQRNGVTRIASIGMALDPNQHQAMLEIPSDEPVGTVVQEMQAGYMLKDRLLRPAMVAVAKKPD
jgi:molecular chaperone GrpE